MREFCHGQLQCNGDLNTALLKFQSLVVSNKQVSCFWILLIQWVSEDRPFENRKYSKASNNPLKNELSCSEVSRFQASGIQIPTVIFFINLNLSDHLFSPTKWGMFFKIFITAGGIWPMEEMGHGHVSVLYSDHEPIDLFTKELAIRPFVYF